MKSNVVVNGLNLGEVLDAIQEKLVSGAIRRDSIITIDVLDGYRHGIKEIFVEGEGVLTIGAKIHEEL